MQNSIVRRQLEVSHAHHVGGRGGLGSSGRGREVLQYVLQLLDKLGDVCTGGGGGAQVGTRLLPGVWWLARASAVGQGAGRGSSRREAMAVATMTIGARRLMKISGFTTAVTGALYPFRG